MEEIRLSKLRFMRYLFINIALALTTWCIIAAAGVNPMTGAIATIVDSYKKGFDYMVKLKVELDRRLDYFFSSGAGYFY